MKSEPLLTTGTVIAVVAVVVALMVAFGVELTEAQTQAILGAAAVLAPLLVGVIARGKVTPTGDVAVARDPDTGHLVAADAYHGAANGTPVDVDIAAA